MPLSDKKIPVELLAWSGGLLGLVLMNPVQAHYSLCVFHLLGFQHCPGCGLGHAISYLLHGDLQASLRAHPLGIPALCILLHRIYVLSLRQFRPVRLANDFSSFKQY